MINVLVLRVTEGIVEKVELPSDSKKQLDALYNEIGCDCIDITNRVIGDKPYDIIVDDIGMFKEDAKVSAVTADGFPLLVGNLVFANHDGEGSTVGLFDDDIYNITHNLAWIQNVNVPEENNLAVILKM